MDRRIEWNVEKHDPAACVGGARAQLREASHDQHGRCDAARRCAHAPPQPEHAELLATRAHELRGLLAAYPAWDDDRLLADILEAVAAHLGENPVDCALQTLRAAHAVAEAIDQLREPFVREAVAQRGLDESLRRRAVWLDVELRGKNSGNDAQPEEPQRAFHVVTVTSGIRPGPAASADDADVPRSGRPRAMRAARAARRCPRCDPPIARWRPPSVSRR